jgi:hypothetical protein
MAREKEILFRATGGDFIDQFDTGSYVRYKAHVTLQKGKTPDLDYINVDFQMSLGDCTRVINWDFEDYDVDDKDMKFDKIDNAIKHLEEAKKDMKLLQKVLTKERARIKKDIAAGKLSPPHHV